MTSSKWEYLFWCDSSYLQKIKKPINRFLFHLPYSLWADCINLMASSGRMKVGYGNSKAESATGLDLYVDDDLDKLESLVGVVPHRFLFSWGYNVHVDASSIAKRVASWEELYQIIQKLDGV